jgi:hypothetical protein
MAPERSVSPGEVAAWARTVAKQAQALLKIMHADPVDGSLPIREQDVYITLL